MENKRRFKIVACVNNVLALGNEGKLLYRIPNDLANLKRMTINNVVIMGRKTFESLPQGLPLPNRINIILTRDESFCVDASLSNVYIVHSIEDAYNLCEAQFSHMDWFVLGGESIYNQFIENDWADEMYITTVIDSSDGDAYFPNVMLSSNWKVIYQSDTMRSRKEQLSYNFSIHKRKREFEVI